MYTRGSKKTEYINPRLNNHYQQVPSQYFQHYPHAPYASNMHRQEDDRHNITTNRHQIYTNNTNTNNLDAYYTERPPYHQQERPQERPPYHQQERQHQERLQYHQQERPQERLSESKDIQQIRNKQYDLFSKRLENALEMFGLNENFEYSELQRSFKNLSLIHHPDRGGTNDFFDFIRGEKEFLQIYLDSVLDNKQHKTDIELVQNYKAEIDSENGIRLPTAEQNSSFLKIETGNRFDSSKFNKFFEENRLSTPQDDGYGDWMKTALEEECPLLEENSKHEKPTINTNDRSKFQSLFLEKKYQEKNKLKNTRKNEHEHEHDHDDAWENMTEVQKFRQINELASLYDMTGDSLNEYGMCELDQSKINDFSSGASGGLSDLKSAYSNGTLIDERNGMKFIHANRTMNDIKQERKKDISLRLGDDEKRYLAGVEKLKEIKEKERREKILQHDNFLDAYSKTLNRKTIKY